MVDIKRNERDWAGQLISWLKSAIEKGGTVFQDVTNDTGVKMQSGRTKFPDVLLFADKVSGVVFNGWELKFPDTPVDDAAMLANALEKAKMLKSDSFVTWNGAEAVIWGIDTHHYTADTLTRLKTYQRIPSISVRDDMADPLKYSAHEGELKKRAYDILHDLGVLFRNGHLKPAIDISGNIVDAIRSAGMVIIPQFQLAIEEEKGRNRAFREAFGKWKIYEGATIRILSASSKRREYVMPEQVLAKFMYYNLVGKILFYLTLSENLGGELEPMSVAKGQDVKAALWELFGKAGEIDYQAIFKPYFTDCIRYSPLVDEALLQLLETLALFDFRILPAGVIGNILENLVPASEKQKFGQYFTPETLANLVAYPAVRTNADVLFDPTSGTGTFLNSFYKILGFHGNKNHSQLLNQIWGNDVSHFPAMLSVVSLYKQDVTVTDNFPRVMRSDFFNLEVGQAVEFPNPHNHKERTEVPLPLFDGIASNFPFIQQEDIQNERLTAFFREKFQNEQPAFVSGGNFKVNERSDYFTYCVYNSIRFLKQDGCLAAITSNAWLGKEYGLQFKRFLLDNFHIRYIVRSTAEHWFKDSQVSTIFMTLERGASDAPTRFVTINKKLGRLFSNGDIYTQLGQIEDFYAEVDNCDSVGSASWTRNGIFRNLYNKADGSVCVSIVPRDALCKSVAAGRNWGEFFYSPDLFSNFENSLTRYFPRIVNVIRGERTGWNDMFVIKSNEAGATGIQGKYLMPYIKSPGELDRIEFGAGYKHWVFVCQDSIDKIDAGTRKWIEKFQNAQNKNGSKTIMEACGGHRPYWYSLRPKQAQIITAINPYDRFFFTYSKQPFTIDQRLIAMQVQNGYDVELIAALFNSVITFIALEMRGTSRNLGALDLNANYLKEIRLLNPDLLSKRQKDMIVKAFAPLKNRPIGDIVDELGREDRKAFDKTIFECYGFSECLLEPTYKLLASAATERISLCKK